MITPGQTKPTTAAGYRKAVLTKIDFRGDLHGALQVLADHQTRLSQAVAFLLDRLSKDKVVR